MKHDPPKRRAPMGITYLDAWRQLNRAGAEIAAACITTSAARTVDGQWHSHPHEDSVVELKPTPITEIVKNGESCCLKIPATYHGNSPVSMNAAAQDLAWVTVPLAETKKLLIEGNVEEAWETYQEAAQMAGAITRVEEEQSLPAEITETLKESLDQTWQQLEKLVAVWEEKLKKDSARCAYLLLPSQNPDEAERLFPGTKAVIGNPGDGLWSKLAPKLLERVTAAGVEDEQVEELIRTTLLQTARGRVGSVTLTEFAEAVTSQRLKEHLGTQNTLKALKGAFLEATSENAQTIAEQLTAAINDLVSSEVEATMRAETVTRAIMYSRMGTGGGAMGKIVEGASKLMRVEGEPFFVGLKSKNLADKPFATMPLSVAALLLILGTPAKTLDEAREEGLLIEEEIPEHLLDLTKSLLNDTPGSPTGNIKGAFLAAREIKMARNIGKPGPGAESEKKNQDSPSVKL